MGSGAGGDCRPTRSRAVSGVLVLVSGKTIQVIGLIAELKGKGVVGPILVGCPLSTLENWMREFRKWTPTIPAIKYYGDRARATACLAARSGWGSRDTAPNTAQAKRAQMLRGPFCLEDGQSLDMSVGNQMADGFPIVVTTYETTMNGAIGCAGIHHANGCQRARLATPTPPFESRPLFAALQTPLSCRSTTGST